MFLGGITGAAGWLRLELGGLNRPVNGGGRFWDDGVCWGTDGTDTSWWGTRNPFDLPMVCWLRGGISGGRFETDDGGGGGGGGRGAAEAGSK